MPTKKRRCVSMTDATYQRIRAYCEAHGLSMASFVEARIHEAIDAAQATQPESLLDLPEVSDVAR